MRLLLYNIRYGTGRVSRHLPLMSYLGRTTETLGKITAFIRSKAPDIVGLLEVDAGSYRSGRRSQSETIAQALGHYHSYQSKYSRRGISRFIPVWNKQGNAFLSRDTIHTERCHYFDRGIKRLVLELEMDNLVVFLVHLAVTPGVRHRQLGDLYEVVRGTEKPHIVAGDFNAMWGDREIRLFLAATGLANADSDGKPSFPSWEPKRQLDFVLHSPRIRSKGFNIPRVPYSDHLPIVYDFEIG